MPVYIEQRVYICAKSVMNDSYVKHPSKLHDSITGFVESKGFLDTIYFTENPIPGQRVVLCFDFYETVHASFDMFDFIEKIHACNPNITAVVAIEQESSSGSYPLIFSSLSDKQEAWNIYLDFIESVQSGLQASLRNVSNVLFGNLA